MLQGEVEERAYVLLAARSGGHLDEARRPVVSVEAALEAYSASRVSLAAAWWEGCAPMQVPVGADTTVTGGNKLTGQWVVRRPDPSDRFGVLWVGSGERIHPVTGGCDQSENVIAGGLGWAIYRGGEPRGDLEVLGLHGLLSDNEVCRDHRIPIDNGVAILSAAPPECCDAETISLYVNDYNRKLRGKLRLSAAQVANLERSAPSIRDWPACKTPTAKQEIICAL